MKTIDIDWAGIRTNNFDELIQLFQTVIGLKVVQKEEEEEDQFVVMSTRSGDKVELFGPRSSKAIHFTTSMPVVGFLVEDIEDRDELRFKGVELIGDI